LASQNLVGSTAAARRSSQPEAVQRAVTDGGLQLAGLNGLIVSGGLHDTVDLNMQGRLGLTDLKLFTQMQAY
jgi:hypothetical protein